MKRSKIYLITSICVIIVVGIAIFSIANRPKCNCAKYLKYEEFTIYNDATFKVREDSICSVGADEYGNLTMKKFPQSKTDK